MASHLHRLQHQQGRMGSQASLRSADPSGLYASRDMVNTNPSLFSDNANQAASHLGSIKSSNMMGAKSYRSGYAVSNLKTSKSFGASRASLATVKSGRSTIQAEFHDMKVHQKLNSVRLGSAKLFYVWAVVFFTIFLLVLFVGLLIMCLRHFYLNIILSTDIGEMTGPLLIACSFIFLGIGFYFLNKAYVRGAQERTFIKYKPTDYSNVTVTVKKEKNKSNEEKLISGQTTEDAVTRAPIGGGQNIYY